MQVRHVVFDVMSTRGHLGNPVEATHQRQRDCSAAERALDSLRACGRIGQHPFAQLDGFLEATLRHRSHGGHTINE